MTLVCECGGHPVVEDGGKVGDVIHETYRCPECGHRGTYKGDLELGTTELSGCLTRC
jgi:hypothetical protein